MEKTGETSGELAFSAQILSVGELLRRARQAVEQEFGRVWVRGEVSGFTRAASGHCYFTIKDEAAQADCVWFARLAALAAPPAEGEEVELLAMPTFFAARGRFQLNVQGLRRGGRGRLYEEFLRRKEELKARGWFAEERKRLPPRWPEKIGVVASIGGAALRDVLKTLSRRWPAEVTVFPAPAQGADAAPKIAAAIKLAGRQSPADRRCSADRQCDVIVVCRGGGGIEDLWAYNTEEVAAAIFESPVAVIAGIGHQTDETIADYVADVRAPTPTAAAAAAAPDAESAADALFQAARRIKAAVQFGLDSRAQRTDAAARILARPQAALAIKQEQLSARAGRLTAAVAHLIKHKNDAADAANKVLNALNPARVLARGYAIVAHNQAAVRSAAQLKSGDEVEMTFGRGGADAIIQKTRAP